MKYKKKNRNNNQWKAIKMSRQTSEELLSNDRRGNQFTSEKTFMMQKLLTRQGFELVISRSASWTASTELQRFRFYPLTIGFILAKKPNF